MLKPKETSPDKEKKINEQDIRKEPVKEEIFEGGDVPAKTDSDVHKEADGAPAKGEEE